MPDWLLPTFLLLPAVLWMFGGVGLCWALAVLPRSVWHRRVLVITVAFGLGPVLTTTAMFLIGTFGRFTLLSVVGGTVITAAIGLRFALRNRSTDPISATVVKSPLSIVEWTLILAIVVAVVLRFWNTAYWPFATYDEFWVYGYNAKMFILHQNIPSSISYYPQLVPLSYTYAQVMWGSLNDHAARTVVPFFALTSILMAYLLGDRLFNRHVGLLTAALWALYPQHAVWSQFGDLEVPITLYFTATATFFMLGWRDGQRRYLILSGLFLGAALWTKPTAAALVESLVLIIIGSAVYWVYGQRRFPHLADLLAVKPIRAGLLTLIVAVPIGGMWYVRNILYGYPPTVLPEGYWQAQAQRSGQELGWPLLIAGIAALLLITHRQRIAAAVGGMVLLLVGSLPSAFGGRLPSLDELSQSLLGQVVTTIQPTHLSIRAVVIILVGVGLLLYAIYPLWREAIRRNPMWRGVSLLVVAFIVPYFVTWFWSYSYHYRLSFAIVPLLIVVLAVLIDQIACQVVTMRQSAIQRSAVLRLAVVILILALALPGWLAVLSAVPSAITGSLPDDDAKMTYGNQALMGLVHFLQQARAEKGSPLNVSAPGELRLPFFFPLDDIRTTDYPIWLDQIANVDFFVDSSVGQRLYIEHGTSYNQILSSLTREPVMQRQFFDDDHNFRYAAYTITNAERFKSHTPALVTDAQFGDFAVLHGWETSTLDNSPGEAVLFTLWWVDLKPADQDYSVFIHLWDATNQKLIVSWGGQPVSGEQWKGTQIVVPYPTRLWQTGETIQDVWHLRLPKNAPYGKYELRVGLYNPVGTGPGNHRLPVVQHGQALGDYLKVADFSIP